VLFELDMSGGRVITSTKVDAPGADPTTQNQRAALTLSNSRVYVPFGGRFGDCGVYHGRVVAVPVSARGLGAITAYTLPTQGAGGFWAPPGAAAGSDGSLYLASGNSASHSTYDYGNSVVRLTPNLRLVDAWAPADWASLNGRDADIGSTSPTLLRNNRLFQIGKSGIGYLLDASHLGGIGGELHQGRVCDGQGAYGSVAHDANTLFVPCSIGIVQVTVTGNTFKVGWHTSVDVPGPAVVSKGTVWTIATGSGALVALDANSGHTISTTQIGSVPSRFTSPALADGHLIVAADRTIAAYGTT
jgi:hypothetical protein